MECMTTVLDTSPVPGVRSLYRLAVILAAISGAFCILFIAILAVNYHAYLGGVAWGVSQLSPQNETDNILPTGDPSYRLPADDSYNRLPTDYQSFLALRQALAQNRQDENLREQIRQLDHDLRINYFQRRTTAQRTTYLLLVSSILFFAAMRTITVLKRQIPTPGDSVRQNGAVVSWRFIIVFSWLMLCGGLYLGLLLAPAHDIEQIFLDKLVAEANTPLNAAQGAAANITAQGTTANIAAQGTTPNVAAIPTAPPAPAIELTEELLLQNWISFRNFDGNGVGFSDNPPIRWDGKTEENIIWKSEVPMQGNSSPVIWENRLFLTGADEETEKIFCYDRTDGTLLWTANVTRPEAKLTQKVDEDTGYAAPTPVVDGRHVYAMFANGELVAVDFSGNLVWRKSFGIPDNSYGFAASPALHFDRLIVQFDNGDGSDGTSKIVALNLNDGSTIWETVREEIPNSWASPTVKKIGDSYQIITCANPYVMAYNPDNGEEIWRVRRLSADVGPSAVSFGNVILITNDFPGTTAIDATGTGDTTSTHVLWVGANASSDSVSSLATEEYYLTLNSYGYLTGYDPKVVNPDNKRARYWELEIGEGRASFYSSPLRVGTLIYAFDKSKDDNARAFVIDLSKIAVEENGMLTEESEAAMIIAVNPMPEPVVTCPAILNNRLYVRGTNYLYCIGEK